MMIEFSLIVLSASSQVGLTTEQWIIGILVTILIAVLGTMGAILKIAYDTIQKWDAVLGGNGDEGHIQRSKDRHADLQESNERVYEQLLIQGKLLSELTYSFAEIAERLEESELDINVRLSKIQDLREQKQDIESEHDHQN